MSIHQGHRQRMKDRFIKNGLTAFSEHEILELLLFYCIPRRDTNEIAHRLIKRFGSVEHVLCASARELESVEGLGSNAVVFLNLLNEVHRHLNISHASEIKSLDSAENCCDYLKNFFSGMQNEVVFMLCLDAKKSVIDCFKIGEGGVTSTNVSVRKIVDKAISCNAASVILAHNHPGGFAIPSPDDVATTYRVAKALMLVDVILVDHIVIADNDTISLRQSGIFDQMASQFEG